MGVHGAASEQAALDELVRVVAHDLAILARSRLSLVRVDHEILRAADHQHRHHLSVKISRYPARRLSSERARESEGGRDSDVAYRPSETLGMNDHLRPDGKPAPPRPRRPETFISLMIQSRPLSSRSLVRCQSPCTRREREHLAISTRPRAHTRTRAHANILDAWRP